MRIITGESKGRIIKAPEGMNTRPTSDRVKESLFNIITNYIFESNVLDLFAGSGNLGLEALSRGAKHCTFVESDKRAFHILQENIRLLKYEEKCDAIFSDAFKTLKSLYNKGLKYDIIFLDPPYSKGMVEKAIQMISDFEVFTENCLIVAEMDEKDVVLEKIGAFRNFRVEKYGRTKIALWKKED